MWESATAAAYAIGQKVEKLVKKTKTSVQAPPVTILFRLLPLITCLVISSSPPSMAEVPPGGFLLDRALADIAAKRSDLSIRPDLFSTPLRRIALGDYLVRRFRAAAASIDGPGR